jgi:phosphoribosylglycinamide formyltransferase 1
MIKVAVLASGRGSDFQAIIDGIEKREVDARIVLLITDNPQAGAIEKAKRGKIPYKILLPSNYGDRLEHDRAILKELNAAGPELVVLAGYMRVIKDKGLLKQFQGKIINIHPSLLPAYPGAHAQKDAFEGKAKVSGYTIHFVDESLDGGPIILQEEVYIGDCKTAQEAADRILEREHAGLPKVVDSFSKGTYKIIGKKAQYSQGK